jgi:guanyl-specific ribonuclease Sa
MNAKKLFLGLLTATVVLTPFATLQPASAGPRRNSTGDIQPTISKDSVHHRTKVVINNTGKKLPTKIDPRKEMQYKQDGKTFENKENKLPTKGSYTEHTVPPRTGKNRGAERIVKDNKGNQFHTKDHYETFKKVTDLKRRNSH